MGGIRRGFDGRCLSRLHGNRESSMRSIISGNSGLGIFDDYKTPFYDDDVMSGVRASAGPFQ